MIAIVEDRSASYVVNFLLEDALQDAEEGNTVNEIDSNPVKDSTE